MGEKTVNVDRLESIISVFGSLDENLKLIENEFNVCILDRNSELHITGDEDKIHYAERAINALMALAARVRQ